MDNMDSALLGKLRECRRVASFKTIDVPALNKEIETVSKKINGCTSTKLVHYLENLVEFLILKTDSGWISWNLDENNEGNVIPLSQLLFICSPRSAIMTLISVMNRLKMGCRLELCLNLMKDFFKSGRFIDLILEQSSQNNSDEMCESVMSETLLSAFNSLPNKIANNTLGKFSDIFHHELFFQFLAIQTGEAIECLSEFARKDKDIFTQFLSRMIGLFSFSGNGGTFLASLLPLVIAKSHSDFIWRRIFQTIFSGISDRHLESAALQLVQSLPWFGCMKWILDDKILSHRKLRFLLLHKFIFVKHFPNVKVLKNIIGYVADNENTRYLLPETLKKLFLVWSDASAIKHVSYEQHKYISQAILVCVSHLSPTELKKYKLDISSWLAPGMGAHLDSTNPRIRMLGMVVAECVTSKTDLDNNNTLKFDHEKNEETVSLKELLDVDIPPTTEYYNELLADYHKTAKHIKSKVENDTSKINHSFNQLTTTKATFLSIVSKNHLTDAISKPDEKNKVTVKIGKPDSEPNTNDNDDEEEDLVPYDMSSYKVYTKVKPPTYIRDCMEGLLEPEDRDKIEASLGAAVDLIKKNPVAAKEVSVEMCKILLTLDDKYAIDHFAVLRLSAMIELVIINPQQVAGYLTHEFYEENYCLQHRLDILDVLTESSKILSSVENKDDKKLNSTLVADQTRPKYISDWKEIVDKRIEAKTRRFGKAKKKIIPAKRKPVWSCCRLFFLPFASRI